MDSSNGRGLGCLTGGLSFLRDMAAGSQVDKLGEYHVNRWVSHEVHPGTSRPFLILPQSTSGDWAQGQMPSPELGWPCSCVWCFHLFQRILTGPCTVLVTVQGTGDMESVIKIKYLHRGANRLMEKSGNKQFNLVRYNIMSGQVVTNEWGGRIQQSIGTEKVGGGRSYFRCCDQGKPLWGDVLCGECVWGRALQAEGRASTKARRRKKLCVQWTERKPVPAAKGKERQDIGGLSGHDPEASSGRTFVKPW